MMMPQQPMNPEPMPQQPMNPEPMPQQPMNPEPMGQPPMGEQPTQSPQGIVGTRGQMQNQKLQQVVQGIEQKVPPQMRDEYDKIVVSGLELMTDPKTQKHVAEVLETAADAPPAERPRLYAHATVKALALVFNEGVSQGPAEAQQKYVDVAPLAGQVLMAHLLDFAEGATGEKITPKFIDQAAQDLVSGFFSAFKIDPRKAEALFSDPQQGTPGAPVEAQQSVPNTPGAPSAAPMPQAQRPMGGGIM